MIRHTSNRVIAFSVKLAGAATRRAEEGRLLRFENAGRLEIGVEIGL
jgi:hypothetical protein